MRRPSLFLSEHAPSRLSKAQVLRSRHCHDFFMFVLVCTYGFALTVLDGDREILSASWREILLELHPDEPKDAERLTEQEVVPKFAEVLHADDITKHLNWFQTFCRDKNGMDDHLEFYWRCHIVEIDLDYDPTSPPLDENMNCSSAFVERHIRSGDDPRCVPYGKDSLLNLQQLARAQGLSEASMADIPATYDEYTVRQGSSMFETLDAELDKVDQQLIALEARVSAKPSHEGPSKGMQANCPARSSGCQIGVAVPGLKNVEEPHMPCSCFSNSHGRRHDGTVFEGVRWTCTNHHWGLIHLCGPRRIDVKFFIERVARVRADDPALYDAPHNKFDLPGRPGRDANTSNVARRVDWFTLQMSFSRLDAGNTDPSGWFRAYLYLHESVFYGFKTYKEGLAGLVATTIIFRMFLWEVLWTVAYFPRNIKRLLLLKDPVYLRGLVLEYATVEVDWHVEPGASESAAGANNARGGSYHIVAGIFRRYVTKLVDGRGGRLRYMSMSEIIHENIAAVFIIIGGFLSFATLNAETIPTKIGAHSAAHPHSSPYQSIMTRSVGATEMVVELMYAAFYNDTTFHGFAWLLLYCRIIGLLLYMLKGTRWLPLTVVLAFVRSCCFLFAYMLLVVGFAIVAYLQFGARFIQFSTLHRSCFELMMLSAGVFSEAFADIFPFQDQGSWMVSIYLSVFLILSVTIGLNFLTTILLDAYTVATDTQKAEALLKESFAIMIDEMMHSFGIPIDECCNDLCEAPSAVVPKRSTVQATTFVRGETELTTISGLGTAVGSASMPVDECSDDEMDDCSNSFQQWASLP